MNQPVRPSPILVPLAVVALVGVLLVLLHWTAPVVTPIMLAAYMAALVAPLYTKMRGWGWSSGVSLAALLLLIVILFAGLGILLVLSASRLQAGLAAYGGGIAGQLDRLLAAIPAADADIAARVDSIMRATLLYFATAIANVAGTLILSTVVVALLLLEIPRLGTLLESEAGKRPVLRVLPVLAETAVQYFFIRTRLNLFTGAGAFLLFWVLGVDYAWLWGVLVFALSYIPYIGLLVASVAPVILAFAEYGPLRAVLLVIGIAVVNVGIENVVAPVYTGRGLNLSPLVVFVAFFFWAWLLGPVGALLAMPITVFVLLVLQEDERTLWLAQMMGSNRPATHIEGGNRS